MSNPADKPPVFQSPEHRAKNKSELIGIGLIFGGVAVGTFLLGWLLRMMGVKSLWGWLDTIYGFTFLGSLVLCVVCLLWGFVAGTQLEEVPDGTPLPSGLPQRPPLSAHVSDDGRPFVDWVMQEGERDADKTIGDNAKYTELKTGVMTATLGNRVRDNAPMFTVTAEGFSQHRRYDKMDGKQFAPYIMPLTDIAGKGTVTQFPVEDLVGFKYETASEMELHGDDLRHFQAGKLHFMQHHIIIAEMRDGTFVNVSRDCQSKQHTLQLLAVLNREFIAKRPPEGWAAMFKKLYGGGSTGGGGPANTPV